MIRKIICAGFLLCLFLAIPLSFMGVHKVEVGGPFLAFLRATSIDLSKFKFEIPSIPTIPVHDSVNAGWAILNVVVNFFNFCIQFMNGVIKIFNFILICFEFIGILIKNLITFRETMATYPILFA